MTTKLGVLLWSQATDWPSFEASAKRVDELGYDSLWTWDHLYAIFGDPYQPIFEGYTTLAAWSKVTTRARLGLLVGANTFRNPGLVAKMLTTIDHASGGRAIAGLGGAWMEEEHTATGIEFGSGFGQRLDWLDESVGALHSLFRGRRVTSPEGAHYEFDDLVLLPAPIQQPIPIMIGGSGEKVTLRLVAELADLCNIGGTAPVVTRKLAALDAHCDAIGRDPATVTRTAMVSLFVCATESDRDGLRQLVGYDNPEVSDRMVIATAGEAAEDLGALAAAGVDEVIVNLPLIKDVDAVHTAAAVLADATS
jgi:alkanesulfonate monooxygenase SsuD/methylene tetrahydromethanopterin reductase-like flavin-dependent oxidoreductase (luciferase family)